MLYFKQQVKALRVKDTSLNRKGFAVFTVNQRVFYPSHGVAVVSRIIEKKIAAAVITLYELKFIHKEMMVLVPMASIESLGIRGLSTDEKIQTIMEYLAQPATRLPSGEFVSPNWNKRYKEYQQKLRRGGLEETSAIYRELKHMAQHKELSYGEKSLLSQTEALLVQEIALVKDLKEDKAIACLRSLFE